MVPLLILCAALFMITVERFRPARHWPRVKGWLVRAWVVSALQGLVVLAFGAFLDDFLQGQHLFVLARSGARLWPSLIGYVVVTFVFYWWHRARHRSDVLWRYLHQFHHSPQRLEAITAFYKHPLELVSNSMITSLVLYVLCGLSPAQAAGTLALCGLGELFYHWNVRTPRWLGLFIQRPEMHCEHHREGIHACNYGDLPVWDLLFGSYTNPEVFDGRCGFGDDEHRLRELLLARKVA
ncbi:MAG: sterol desaturase family protein [Myxococcales bacterium]